MLRGQYFRRSRVLIVMPESRWQMMIVYLLPERWPHGSITPFIFIYDLRGDL